jgi:hypothetical protein
MCDTDGGLQKQAFRWRVLAVFFSALAWTAWILAANRGESFRLTPTDNDLQTMNEWFHWWGIMWLKFIPVFGDILLCTIVGGLVFPWGVSLTLSALIVPILSLMRPYRDFRLSTKTSIHDFIFQRLIYVFIVLCIYFRTILPDVADRGHLLYGVEFGATAGMVGTVVFRILFGFTALSLIAIYFRFVVTSVRHEDPFPALKHTFPFFLFADSDMARSQPTQETNGKNNRPGKHNADNVDSA